VNLRSCVPALLLVLCGRAAADTFTMRDGSSVDGEVVREFPGEGGRPDRWEVRTLKGTRILAAADVRARKPGGGPYPWRIFEEEFVSVDPRNAEENYLLGVRARAQGLEAEAVRAFRRAIEADPGHARARTALGHILVDGRWVVPAGQPESPEDRGTPVPSGPPSALETGLGRTLAKRESDAFRVESSWLDQYGLGRMLDTLERAREATLSFLAEPPPVGARRATYYLLRDGTEYRRAVDALVAPAMGARADRDVAARELALYRSAHLSPLPPAGPGCVAWKIDEGETADRAFLAHFAVHETWRSVCSPGTRDPDWLREAVAYSVLNDVYPDDPTWCVAATYGRQERVPGPWRNTRTWAATARNLAASGKALAFQDLAVLDLNSLSFDALVQSWSVLQVLRAKDDSGTRTFLRRVRRGTDQFQALKECLHLDPAGVDRLWRAEVLRGR
jgi:hypothetical protein